MSSSIAVKFDNVTKRFGDNLVLNKINLNINEGEIFGIIGRSGSGKTTIGNLLFRFFDPASGAVTIDGIDLRDLKIKSIRDAIGIVSQESVLFNTTMKENIKFGNPNASNADVVRAAKLAHLHDFITRQKKGYESKVGARGVKLSGGEKQRISIARVFLKNPKILILDEATSSLDSESEYLIQQALQRVTEGRTTLVIAHRLSTIRNANAILVLKDQKIREQGSFAQLMKKKGLFYYFYKTQFAKAAVKRTQTEETEETAGTDK